MHGPSMSCWLAGESEWRGERVKMTNQARRNDDDEFITIEAGQSGPVHG